MGPLDLLIQRLDENYCQPRPCGSGYSALCPVHEWPSSEPSLTVNRGDDGRALLHCHAGCPTEDILEALDLAWGALFYEKGSASNQRHRDRREIQPPPLDSEEHLHARHRYLVAEGDVGFKRGYLLSDLRSERGWTLEVIEKYGIGWDEHKQRAVIPVHGPDGRLVSVERYDALRLAGKPKTLASEGRTRELFPAPESIEVEELWLVEGAADALAGHSNGLPAVGIPGANGWKQDWAARFNGKRVVVCCDSDQEGRELAQKVADSLYRQAAEVRNLDLDPDSENGYDLSDFVVENASHGAGDRLRELAASAPTIQGEAVGSSWAAVDLEPLLEGDPRAVETTLLTRTDGIKLLYPARTHLVFGEPESGKGWLVVAAVVEVLRDGGRAVYFDFEDEADLMLERLRAFGVSNAEILTGLVYVRPDEPLPSDEQLAHLYAGAQLVVLDGLTEALVLHGLSPESNEDVAKFQTRFVRPASTAAATSVLIDHVPKDAEHGDRYSIGAQHKRAMIDGASYRLEAVEPFGVGKEGRTRIKLAKDRRGRVRAHADGKLIGTAVLRSDVNTGAVTVTIEPPETNEKWGERWRPTFLMEQVSRALERSPGLSKQGVRDEVHFRAKEVDRARGLLVQDGFVRVERDGQAERHYSIAEYRENEPEPRPLVQPRPNVVSDEGLTPTSASSPDGRPPTGGPTGTGSRSDNEDELKAS